MFAWANSKLSELAETIAPVANTPGFLFINACRNGNVQEAIHLVQMNGIQAASPCPDVTSGPNANKAPIFIAAEFGVDEIVEFFMQNSPGLNIAACFDSNGNSLLHYAAKGGSLKLCKLLIDQFQCDTTVKNAMGLTPHDFTESGAVRQYLLPIQLQAETKQAIATGGLGALPAGIDLGSFRQQVYADLAPPPTIIGGTVSAPPHAMNGPPTGTNGPSTPGPSVTPPVTSAHMYPSPLSSVPNSYPPQQTPHQLNQPSLNSMGPPVAAREVDTFSQTSGQPSSTQSSFPPPVQNEFPTPPLNEAKDGAADTSIGSITGESIVYEMDKLNVAENNNDASNGVTNSPEAYNMPAEPQPEPASVQNINYQGSSVIGEPSLTAEQNGGSVAASTFQPNSTKAPSVAPFSVSVSAPNSGSSLPPPPFYNPPSYFSTTPAASRPVQNQTKRTIRPDGFHSSASDVSLQEKYGHVKQAYNVSAPPPSVAVNDDGSQVYQQQNMYSYSAFSNGGQYKPRYVGYDVKSGAAVPPPHYAGTGNNSTVTPQQVATPVAPTFTMFSPPAAPQPHQQVQHQPEQIAQQQFQPPPPEQQDEVADFTSTSSNIM